MAVPPQYIEELIDAQEYLIEKKAPLQLHSYEVEAPGGEIIFGIKGKKNDTILKVSGKNLFYHGPWLELFSANDIRGMALLIAEHVLLSDKTALKEMIEGSCDS